MYVVLTILTLAAFGVVSVASVFMSGFTGETLTRIVTKLTCILLLALGILFLFQ